MNLNPFKKIKPQLYFLQLENYQIKRFLKSVKKVWQKDKQEFRGHMDWTAKMKIVFITALLSHIVITAAISIFIYFLLVHSFAWSVLIFFVLLFLFTFPYYIFLSLSAFIIKPLDSMARKRLAKKAQLKLSKMPNLKIVGITGSFGKTTTKEVLKNILQEKYKVVITPENLNIEVSVSRFILKSLPIDTQIFIVEMGVFQQGDVKKLCQIAKPDVSILTGINEAHLERLKTIDRTIATKFEIVDFAKPDATIILNADNQHVLDNYQTHIKNRQKTLFYSAKNYPQSEYQVKDQEFFEDGSGLSFTLTKDNQIFGPFKTPFLGEYIIGTIMACIIVAKQLGLTDDQIKQGVSKTKPVPKRLEPIINPITGVLVIDDSYNGNPEGVKQAIQTLAKFKNRRKIYVTPGIPELGEKADEIHHSIGKQLAQVVNKVLLIKSSAASQIAKGLEANNFSKENIIWFDNMPAVVPALKNILKSGDIILFQNDWPDNYS